MKYNINDTIAAISTPIGHGGLGVVRISGDDSLKILKKIFKVSKNKSLDNVCSHTLHHGWITDKKQIIDEVIAAIMHKPNTYTGENIVEISAHGSIVVLNKILSLILNEGARLAGPGEFTFRAFVNNRMDLAKAEAVADLISSKTELFARAAVDQLYGKFSERISLWRKDLVDLISNLEVSIDYCEEDIEAVANKDIKNKLKKILKEIQSLLETSSKGNILKHGLKISIIGKPNVGKSSLLNTISQKEKSIVTEIPGTTRDVIEETLNIKGIPILINDTAGLREHSLDPVEKIGQERTINCIKSSDLILWLIDASQPINQVDNHINDLIKTLNSQDKVILVWNKIDCTKKINLSDVKDFSKTQIKISALTGKGIQDLENAILEFIDIKDISIEEPILINLRHQKALENTYNETNQALASTNENKTEEIIAFHLKEALNSLGEITGETTTEDILNNIFSNFCVGK